MNKPIVSVIVLTFNSECYITRCLRSLVRQSFQQFEAIIVDAGSKDRTREIVAQFDERFRWIELPASDMGAARNYGMKNSQGNYLMFLDSDDFYLREKIERQVTILEKNLQYDVAFCTAWHFRTGNPDCVGLKQLNAQPMMLQDFLSGLNHNLNTMCIRRKVWEAGVAFGEGDRGRYGEEWRLQLAMAQREIPMIFDNDPLVMIEIRPDSHTGWSIQWKMKKEAIKEVERVVSRLSPEQLAQVGVPSIIDNFRYKLVMALLLDGRKKEAEQTALQIRNNKLSILAQKCVMLGRCLPNRSVQVMLRYLWLKRQDRSFAWQKTSDTLQSEFAEVEK